MTKVQIKFSNGKTKWVGSGELRPGTIHDDPPKSDLVVGDQATYASVLVVEVLSIDEEITNTVTGYNAAVTLQNESNWSKGSTGPVARDIELLDHVIHVSEHMVGQVISLDHTSNGVTTALVCVSPTEIARHIDVDKFDVNQLVKARKLKQSTRLFTPEEIDKMGLEVGIRCLCGCDGEYVMDVGNPKPQNRPGDALTTLLPRATKVSAGDHAIHPKLQVVGCVTRVDPRFIQLRTSVTTWSRFNESDLVRAKEIDPRHQSSGFGISCMCGCGKEWVMNLTDQNVVKRVVPGNETKNAFVSQVQQKPAPTNAVLCDMCEDLGGSGKFGCAKCGRHSSSLIVPPINAVVWSEGDRVKHKTTGKTGEVFSDVEITSDNTLVEVYWDDQPDNSAVNMYSVGHLQRIGKARTAPEPPKPEPKKITSDDIVRMMRDGYDREKKKHKTTLPSEVRSLQQHFWTEESGVKWSQGCTRCKRVVTERWMTLASHEQVQALDSEACPGIPESRDTFEGVIVYKYSNGSQYNRCLSCDESVATPVLGESPKSKCEHCGQALGTVIATMTIPAPKGIKLL